MYGLLTIKKILSIKEREGLSVRKAAKRFGLSPKQYLNRIKEWCQREREYIIQESWTWIV